MTTTRFVNVLQYKGGVGATTFRCALAIEAARDGLKVLVCDDDAAAVLGCAADPTDDVYAVLPDQLFVTGTSPQPINDGYDLVITSQRWYHVNPERADLDVALLMTTPCYVALRRAVYRVEGVDLAGVVLLDEPGRSLHARDVIDVLGLPVLAVIDRDPAVARMVDAGVLIHRRQANTQLAVAARTILALVDIDSEVTA